MWITDHQELVRQRIEQLREKKMTTDADTMTITGATLTFTRLPEPQPPLVDSDGDVDLSRMRREYDHLCKLIDERKLLDAAIEEYENRFKTAVEAAQGATGFKIDGLSKVTWKPDGNFPTAKYTAANPHIAAVYTKTVTRKVFDLESFKRDRAAEFDQWRARSFRHVTGKKN